jgi:hypothetical protein
MSESSVSSNRQKCSTNVEEDIQLDVLCSLRINLPALLVMLAAQLLLLLCRLLWAHFRERNKLSFTSCTMFLNGSS